MHARMGFIVADHDAALLRAMPRQSGFCGPAVSGSLKSAMISARLAWRDWGRGLLIATQTCRRFFDSLRSLRMTIFGAVRMTISKKKQVLRCAQDDNFWGTQDDNLF
jgi:hypothetical protein